MELGLFLQPQQSEAFTSDHKSAQIFSHGRRHAAPSFIAVMRPGAPQCPGVSRPLQLLTGKGSVHQRAVVSKKAAADSRRIRGRVFDVTTRVEVTSQLRPRSAEAFTVSCPSHYKILTRELEALCCYCQCSRHNCLGLEDQVQSYSFSLKLRYRCTHKEKP